jgi:hypothetical protein
LNHKPVARTPSSVALAIAMALSQLVASNIAQADSVHEWGYWDAATAAGSSSGGDDGFSNVTVNTTTTPNSTTGQNIHTDQRVIGTDNGQFLLAANAVPISDYVGYTICYNGCGATRVGTVYIDVTQGAERLADHTHYVEQAYWWTGGNPYYVQDTSYYDGKVAITGTFNGQAFNLNDSAPNLQNTSYTYYYGDTNSYNYVNSKTENANFDAQLNYTYNGVDYSGPVKGGSIGTGDSWGQVLFGKPVAATQIAEQLRLGQTYNFSGGSQMGSYVQIAVNFQNASWNGTWSASNNGPRMLMIEPGVSQDFQNGFTASGGISGSTLASKSVTGMGTAGLGFVTAGKVDATLVGVIRGTDASAAAVIGKTVITVQQAVGTKTMGDVFSATSGLGCKGCEL